MGTRRPASRKALRSPSAAGNPPAVPASESASIPRGLKSISAARRPPKSATRKIRCRRASRELAQYWASISRQARSGCRPHTIPAAAHCPEAGIGISALWNAASTALKSNPSFDERLPMTFSQTAITGNTPPLASLISRMIRIAW